MKPTDFTFPPLNLSLGERLGPYYQDFTPAVTLVEGGYHGRLDDDGAPLVRYPGGIEAFNAITAGQYALGLHTRCVRGEGGLETRLRSVLERLVKEQTREGPRSGFWEMRFDNPKYRHLRAPWISALAQGNAASALLRGWETLREPRFREAAERGLEAMHRRSDPTPTAVEIGEDLWYEEYPAEDPVHVLNGHVYAAFGVLDLARVSGSELWMQRWQRAAATCLRHLDVFDLGYWSAYDAYYREPVDLHYHRNIHIPLLSILARLTGEPAFSDMVEKWTGYLRSPRAHLRRFLRMKADGLRARWRRL